MEKIIDGILVESQPCVIGKGACENCAFFRSFRPDRKASCATMDNTCIMAPEMLDENWRLKPVPSHFIEESVKSEIDFAGEMYKEFKPSSLTNRHFVDNLWRWKCGMEELEETPFEPIDIDKLAKEQVSQRFIELMTNRMVLGTLRYGRWQDNKFVSINT